jgi:hypothetical protein
MNEGKTTIDCLLNQLAIEAQQHPPRSYERRKALSLLADKILNSDRLASPQKRTFPYHSSLYEDLYNEALSNTLMEICQKIDRYNPEQDVMAWCNFLLGKRFTDSFKQYINRGITHIARGCETPTIEALNHFIPAPEQISESLELQKLIEENPGNLFTQDHVKGQPRATFQFLALAKIWQDQKWKEISSELNVPVSSLCEFFNKRLKEFKPYFQDYLQN